MAFPVSDRTTDHYIDDIFIAFVRFLSLDHSCLVFLGAGAALHCIWWCLKSNGASSLCFIIRLSCGEVEGWSMHPSIASIILFLVSGGGPYSVSNLS